MRQRRPTATLLLVLLTAGLLVGCNGAERERRQAERQRAERQQAGAAERQRQLNDRLSRCRRQQPEVQRQLQALTSSSSALAWLERQRYDPLPRPAAPDPALLARFTRDDQEMEQERYAQALARWRQSDAAERRRWESRQEGGRQEHLARQQAARTALAGLGVAATAEAQAAWSSCDPQRLAALALP